MKKKQKMFIMSGKPVTVTKEDNYTEVSIYNYNGSIDITINREWETHQDDRHADKKELADVKKLIEALQEIVEYAEGF